MAHRATYRNPYTVVYRSLDFDHHSDRLIVVPIANFDSHPMTVTIYNLTLISLPGYPERDCIASVDSFAHRPLTVFPSVLISSPSPISRSVRTALPGLLSTDPLHHASVWIAPLTDRLLWQITLVSPSSVDSIRSASRPLFKSIRLPGRKMQVSHRSSMTKRITLIVYSIFLPGLRFPPVR